MTSEPPATADVEEAHPRLQPELATDQVELGLLGGVKLRLGRLEIGTRVHEPPVEPERVELVSDVVVETDRRQVACPRVAAPGELRDAPQC
jgi:hypothetical protein